MILTDGVHLVSDLSEYELITFANSVGLPKSAYDRNPKHPHYDVGSDRIKQLIVKSGKVEVIGSKELVRRYKLSRKLKNSLISGKLLEYASEEAILVDLCTVLGYNEHLFWHIFTRLYFCPSLPALHKLSVEYFTRYFEEYYLNFDSEPEKEPYGNPFSIKSGYSYAQLQKFTADQLRQIGLWSDKVRKPASVGFEYRKTLKSPIDRRKWAIK